MKILKTTNTILFLACSAVAATSYAVDPGFDKLSDPLDNITADERADFDAGLVVFKRAFGPAQGGGGNPPMGGGPLRNTFGPNSCVQCHNQVTDPDDPDGVIGGIDGAGHTGFRATQVTAYHEATGQCDHLEDRGGPGFQVNTGALLALGFSAPLAQENPGPFAGLGGEYISLESQDGTPVGPRDDRTTNDLFGLGMLDKITDSRLSALADPNDANGDGISGRVHWVTDHHGEIHAGKFGRKAEVAHLDEFNAEAFQNEQGVTNPEFMDDGVYVIAKMGGSLQDLVTESLDDVFADPEVSQEDLDLLNAYVRFLAPPAQNPDAMSEKDRNQGSRIFNQTGCADCHTPLLTTGSSESKALRHKVIRPYSDLLLHDMGPGLAEGCKGDATPSEWRTEPLWGLRFVALGGGAFGAPPSRYMHDGRAVTLADAIGLHGGEAAGSRAAYNELSADDKQLLIDFLNTL